MKNNNDGWTDEFIVISSVAVPLILILLSIFTPKSLVSDNQKDNLLTAGLTAMVAGGIRGAGRKTEIKQEVQTQEMNLGGTSNDYVSPSTNEYVQYNPPQQSSPYLAPVSPEDLEFVRSREHRASSPYKVVNPDD